jgi:peptidyl-prolyl cis-trans isomerase A (cyclophilin A)
VILPHRPAGRRDARGTWLALAIGLVLLATTPGVWRASELAAAPAEAAELPAQLAGRPGWYARIATSLGTFVLRLLPEQAPQSVAHFAALAEGRLAWNDPFTGESKTAPYYDGTTVHLVEAGQRFEAGDRTATGRGAPPFYVPAEGAGPITFDKAGRAGMTRSAYGVSAVQFFVTATGTPWLRGHHPCFGEVAAGMDVVQAITGVKTGPGQKPAEPITINRVTIHRVGDVPPLPEPVAHRPKRKPFGPRSGSTD